MQPWPTASTSWHPREPGKEPLRLIVHKTARAEGHGPPGCVLEAEGDHFVVAAGTGALRLLVVQTPGKRAITASEFLRGHRVLPGDRLGD
jgi:methionyl-tRNA formyltransferase